MATPEVFPLRLHRHLLISFHLHRRSGSAPGWVVYSAVLELPVPQRVRVGVIFGGQSGEHEVSLASAYSVMRALDPERYEVVPIGIAKDGRWLAGGSAWSRLRAAATTALGPGEEAGALPHHSLLETTRGTAPVASPDGLCVLEPAAELRAVDVVFPVLHGPLGEDGTVQGLLELAGVPYVGAGVAGSALCMDKVLCKRVLASVGIPQGAFIQVLRADWQRQRDRETARVAALGYPCFVKPANLGSSVGISKVHAPEELDAAMALAASYDRKVIVEASIEAAKEIEVSVLGNDTPVASVPGEVIPCNEFYDYNAKYVDGESKLIIPAELPAAVADEVRRLAVQAFIAVDGAGLARVDFLVQPEGWRIYLNEINTLPGFTPISMYPKLWEATGLGYRELLSQLIDLALERHREQRHPRTSA